MSDEKKAFAKCLIDGMDTTRASMTVFPITETLTEQEKNHIRSKRMIAAVQWETDKEVLAYTKEIMGVEEPLPELMSKEDHIKELEKIFKDEDGKGYALRERLVASDQIAKIQGFINPDKGNTTVNNKLLIMYNSGTDDEWEKKIAKQQSDLVERTLKTIEVKDVSND